VQLHCTPAFDLCIIMSNAKFEVFRSSRNSQYYFRLKSRGNSETILGSEGYYSKQGCFGGIASVKAHAPYDSNYERKDGYQNYTFNLKAGNDKIIGRSENYNTPAGRENGIAAVKRDAPGAGIVDLT